MIRICVVSLSIAGILVMLGGCGNGICESAATESVPVTGRLTDLVRISRVVRFANANLRLGMVAKVVEQSENGDLFVSDGGWSSGVYRFDRHGRFVRAYSLEGIAGLTGESLIDYAVDRLSVYLLTEKLLLRVRISDGETVASVRPPSTPLRVVSTGLETCVFAALDAIRCFDARFAPSVSLPTRETDKFAALIYIAPFPFTVATNRRIVLAEAYSPSLLLYDLDSVRSRAVRFPNSKWDAEVFERRWRNRSAQDSTRAFQERIRSSLRRFTKDSDQNKAFIFGGSVI